MAELTPEHRDYLAAHAVDPDLAERLGVRSLTSKADLEPLGEDWASLVNFPAIAFPWTDEDGRVEWQVRPDEPTEDNRGRKRKYLFRRGMTPVLWAVRPVPGAGRIVIVEGTKQCLTAAQYAPPGVAVYGIAGCRMWQEEGVPLPDLFTAEDREVVVILDADAATNLDVYQAGETLASALDLAGATKVTFTRLPASGKSGLDDVLAAFPEGKRAGYLARAIDRAKAKPADTKPKAKAKAKKDGPAKLPESGDGRTVVITSQDRKIVKEELSKALTSMYSGTELFNHGGVISRYRKGKMAPLDRGTFNDVASDAALMVSESTTGYVPGWADENTMRAVLSRAEDYAPLSQIRRCPFVRADGSICQVPGYDEASRSILTEEGALDCLEVPEQPTAADVAAARELILTEWLGDMPFPDQASRANALALVLTPFVRAHFPRVPLAVVDGLQMGVGKNKLADCLAIVTTGEAADPMNWVDDNDELRKQITSAFRTGAETFVFDEAHEIGGAALAQALTAEKWQDRLLGGNVMANFPNVITWISLGNNVKVAGDIIRRVYRIALRPSYANPQDRPADTFRHPGVSGLELEDWTRANRAALVRAVLVLVRAWFAAGQPAPSRRLSFGSFTEWERMVGGIIDHAGVPGFLGNLKAWRDEASTDKQFVIAHLAWLHETFGEAEFRTAEVRTKALTDPAGHHALLGLEDPSDKKYTVELGKAYGRLKEQDHGGYRLLKRGGHAKTVFWTVSREVSEVSEVCPTPYTSAEKHSPSVGSGDTPRVSKEETAGGHPSDTSDTSAPVDPPVDWVPSAPGDGVAGYVTELSEDGDEEFGGLYPVVILRTRTGLVRITGSPPALRRALADAAPEVGNAIGVKFLGERPINGDPNRKAGQYRVIQKTKEPTS
ncbi:DUF3854 domain-containing protein [Micromonospora chalcea]|uniref:DUF3854 domain-containing protein n=1 Tax=Micromonospora chalcea TaxID=1874 RepID=UPI0038F6C7D0